MTGFEVIVMVLRTMTDRGWTLESAATVDGHRDYVSLYAKKGDQSLYASLSEFGDRVLITLSAFHSEGEHRARHLFVSTASPDEAIGAIPDVSERV